MTSFSPPKVDIVVSVGVWRRVPALADITRKAIHTCWMTVGVDAAVNSALCILLCSDKRIRELNKTWRGIDKATNVLSFTGDVGPDGVLHGDIVVAYETVEREAWVERKPFANHYQHMIIHGFLHVLGYDHIHHVDAEVMELEERRTLARLSIPDPYRTRKLRKRANRSGRRN